MSLHLEFEPHSWYKQFAIRRNAYTNSFKWTAVTLNGNTGYIVEHHSDTLKQLKQQINKYHERNAERDAYNRAQIGE